MYKEIEDLLHESMKINTAQKEKLKKEITEQENQVAKSLDPLQGIEEGLELVNNILTQTIGSKPDNSCDISRRSDLAKYLNFHSNSQLECVQSSMNASNQFINDHYYPNNNENFPMRLPSGSKMENEIGNNLQPFLIENHQIMDIEDSPAQLMSSPVFNSKLKETAILSKEQNSDDSIEPVIFTPERMNRRTIENKENH